ncbi:MAG: hypothetical protein IPF92_24875 [Myxococcales bacterium]|nr:hypothetical protein [Myxococcales bacterium]
MNTETTTTSTTTKTTDASEIARIAFGHHFSTWHGFGEVGGDERVYLFSNAPSDDRPRILAELTEHMKGRGCELVSSGSYPEKGEDAGYTVALIFAPSPAHGANLQALRIFFQAAAIRMFPGQCGYPNGTVHHMGTVRDLMSTTDKVS